MDRAGRAVAERQQYLTMAVRDFLNEGGKLVPRRWTIGTTASSAGRWAASTTASTAPRQDCAVTVDPFSDCLLLADDFTQYYLGRLRAHPARPDRRRRRHEAGPLAGVAGPRSGAGRRRQPDGRSRSARVTSDVLPADQFPQFASQPVADYVGPEGPFFAIEGDYAGAGTRRRQLHAGRRGRTT